MAKILLTGGSGFVAAHILNVLLANGHKVVTTVRSKPKGEDILAGHPDIAPGELSFEVVNDIAQDGAFDEVFQKHVDFEAVIHAASPFHDKFDDPSELLDPAIKGTTGILKAIPKYAPTVRRVVVTSSFASMVNENKAPEVYDETCWNPVSWDDATTKRNQAYRGSKTFAEKAAWEFMAKEKPKFDLVTICPPMVYGPIVHKISSLAAVNTSNQRILDLIQGKYSHGDLPSTGTLMWIDVRDLAAAHVRAVEVEAAGGQRFFATGGHYSNKTLVDAIKDTHPELASRLPTNPVDELIDKQYTFDNTKIKQVLGMQFRPLHDCVDATVASLLELGA